MTDGRSHPRSELGPLPAKVRLGRPDLGVVVDLCSSLWHDEPRAEHEAHAASILGRFDSACRIGAALCERLAGDRSKTRIFDAGMRAA